ncbi:MAG TPA: hypothetical protein VHN15_11120 [Thermoanaerobaculia bacterium]|nr:hypothetical protein [Thermoanaerobaculia bacterium]
MIPALRSKAVLFSLACLLTTAALFSLFPSEAAGCEVMIREYCTYSTGGHCWDTCRRGNVCRGDISGVIVDCTYTQTECCAGN